jgi:hypothetical protein
MPSSTLPKMTNVTIVTARNVGAPPGRPVMKAAREEEKPDWVSAQAIAVAAPMISRIEPERAAVSISIG